jgi:AraC family transcriptional activator of tynA and feaB
METWNVSNVPGRTLREFGPLRIVQLSCGRCTIERAPHGSDDVSGQLYTLILQVRGQGVFTQYGHEAVLGPGDFTLCQGEAPYTYQLGDDCDIVMVRVPASLLKEHLPSPESFCGRHLPAAEGLTGAAALLVASLCGALPTELSPEFEHRVARHLLATVATSYAIAFESGISSSSNIGAWHARVRLYIEQHLRTPDLTPCSIASKLKLSPRYLRMIFASSHETVSAYILRRRIEECARQIEDPRWSEHSITEIAFSWGFNSAPHFTRSFRERYGTSPRHYRHSVKSRRQLSPSKPTLSGRRRELPLPGPARAESRGSF